MARRPSRPSIGALTAFGSSDASPRPLPGGRAAPDRHAGAARAPHDVLGRIRSPRQRRYSDPNIYRIGAGTGEASDPLGALVHTAIPSAGFAASNRGRYGNPKVDELIEQALVTVDSARREALLIAAADVAIKDHAVLPLFFSTNV